ncbi:hypothetical protein [Enterococcus saccharolyticus]|uniref:Uncharacterized protein n=1 Tax=Enterococcus saccharolyticus subsp. saccharolyticus ATCC 43076 TaxID=1139996 RepID=S0JMS1_9ENTE|nr:hypothetical protein [Enterococcus saccharolyticus]EOT29815.1 hypothetical protein OMQ_00505 [Enterococcus saccharolyticus subsp. saccharolyticus ATCC 43076]EOT80362.1 hypothetical protein I572_00887 [Enterococcus saccharolyticus subsp. saccharolyticus ATCC 43076]OJG88285.1 hypothetical protein RV16_GL000388 [Enterococcus saccharolyticus]
MAHSKRVDTKQKKKIPIFSSEYRPKLENLPAFSTVSDQTPIDIYQLIEHISLSPKADYFEEIYAIIPVHRPLWGASCVIYRENVLLVDDHPFHIVCKLLQHLEHVDYPIYRQVLGHMMNKKERLTPVASQNYSLFPTAKVDDSDTMWLNPGRIHSLITQNRQTIVCFENLFALATPKKIDSLKKGMKKAFFAHAIIKREHDCRGTRSTTSLLEFLNVTSSVETREILKNIEFQHIPGYQHDFFRNYPKFQDAHSQNKAKRELHRRYSIEL